MNNHLVSEIPSIIPGLVICETSRTMYIMLFIVKSYCNDAEGYIARS